MYSSSQDGFEKKNPGKNYKDYLVEEKKITYKLRKERLVKARETIRKAREARKKEKL